MNDDEYSDYDEEFDDNENYDIETDSEESLDGNEDIDKKKIEGLDELNDLDELEDDISEIYQPKPEKKIELISKLKTRNIIIVPPDERITDNRLHKNEVSFILSTRSKEIAMHSTHFAKDCIATNAISIAYQELYSNRCPLKLRRQVGITNKGDIIVEEWDTKEMVLPNIGPF